MSVNRTFGKRCRILRKRAGKSLSYMRRKSEFGEKYRKWEVEGVMPTAPNLFRLAKYFDVSPYYLMGLSDIPGHYEPDRQLTDKGQQILSEDETEHMKKYRCLSSSYQDYLNDYLTLLCGFEASEQEGKNLNQVVQKMPLKDIRRNRRITKDTLFKMIEISPVVYNDIEECRVLPTVNQAKAICKALGVKMSDVKWVIK